MKDRTKGIAVIALAGAWLGLVIVAEDCLARPKQDARGNKPEIMDSPIPVGSPPMQIPDQRGYNVIVLEQTADGQVHQVGLRVDVRSHDLRLDSWRGAEQMRVASYLGSVRAAIRKAGEYAGKSETWIVQAQAQIGEHSLIGQATRIEDPLSPDYGTRPKYCKGTDQTPLVDFYEPHARSLMISGGTTVSPQCAGNGCGSIVCASVTKRNGVVVGCGGGCGGCSIVTVCPG